MDRIDDDMVPRLDAELGDALRSVVCYTDDDYEVLFLRDDVADRYAATEIADGVEEMRFETLQTEYINDLFERTHGELRASVTFFEDAVEMNFPVADGVGVSVAVDAEYFTAQNSLVQVVEDCLADHEQVVG